MAMAPTVQSPSPVAGDRAQQWCRAQLRAMAIWPRLDRRALARCGCDTGRIATYVGRRTRMPLKAIESLLERE